MTSNEDIQDMNENRLINMVNDLRGMVNSLEEENSALQDWRELTEAEKRHLDTRINNIVKLMAKDRKRITVIEQQLEIMVETLGNLYKGDNE